MPELPEVETTRRGILPWLQGRRVTGCSVRAARLRVEIPSILPERLAGQRLLDVRRRAKYLLLMFPNGALIIHLGMSGNLRIHTAQTPAGLHDHFDLTFGNVLLRMHDPRRFGMILWHEGDPLCHPLLAGLGPEPLEEGFDGALLRARLWGVRQSIKQALMDSHRIAGVGNIYASESLFRSAIHPLVPAGALGIVRCSRLAAAVRETLADALAAGGSTLRDYVGGDGREGCFQHECFVYGREGQPCRKCATPVRKSVTGQRATYWCPRCQRR
jgi:formamidopyrimidine-DNA glycosylase